MEYIDGMETEIKLDSGANVVIAHVDLINPFKIKLKQRIKLLRSSNFINLLKKFVRRVLEGSG